MKLIIESDVVMQEEFQTHSELVNGYRSYEESKDRVPPAFAWEQLLIAIGIFVAEYLGEKVLDQLWEKLQGKTQLKPDARKILVEYARTKGPVRLVLETKAEAEILQQLRAQLPGVEIVTANGIESK